jgi:hypothetical protein
MKPEIFPGGVLGADGGFALVMSCWKLQITKFRKLLVNWAP